MTIVASFVNRRFSGSGSVMLPVILLGTERSGTNLLRRYLAAHSEIACPPPAGLISPLASCSHLYLDKRIGDDGVAHWAKAALALIDAHPADWDVPISVDDILSRRIGDSHWDLFRAVNEHYARHELATTWFSKEPEAIHFFADLIAYLPDAKFIYLVRDGRDVAASMLRGGVHEQHVYGAAMRWQRDQAAGIALLEDPSLRERIYLVKYEDFISDHETEVFKIFDFIGCARDEKVFASHRNARIEKQTKDSKLWENLGQPVRADNYGNYKGRLSASEIAIFETVARDPLVYFGYERETSEPRPLTTATRLRIRIETVLNILRNRFDKAIRRENRIRRKFGAVAKRIGAGKPFD